MAAVLQGELPLFAPARPAVPDPGPAPARPSGMWPKGRLNRGASIDDLQAELAWQRHWKAFCLYMDEGCQLRAGWAQENIDEVSELLEWRKQHDG